MSSSSSGSPKSSSSVSESSSSASEPTTCQCRYDEDYTQYADPNFMYIHLEASGSNPEGCGSGDDPDWELDLMIETEWGGASCSFGVTDEWDYETSETQITFDFDCENMQVRVSYTSDEGGCGSIDFDFIQNNVPVQISPHEYIFSGSGFGATSYTITFTI